MNAACAATENTNLSTRSRSESADLRVLIVDDEPDILEEMDDILRSEGIYSYRATDARSALDIIASGEQIDAIITDIRMPGMNGLEFTRAIKGAEGDTALLGIVILTGHAGFDEAVEALQAGAEDFLSKPVDPDRLVHSVIKAAELTRLRRTEKQYQRFLAKEVQNRADRAYELEIAVASKEREIYLQKQSLAAATRAREEFFALISHELRTPLILIQSFAAKLADPAIDSAEAGQNLAFIKRAGEDALKYLDAVLSLSAFDLQRDNSKGKTQTSLKTIFEQLETAVGNRLRENALRIKSQAPEGLAIKGQGARLAQALNFLLEDAIAESENGKHIHLSARSVNAGLQISIARSGAPIKARAIDLMTKSFDEFDLESLRDGTLGERINLPLARIFVDEFGGHIEVENEPDRGATISILLPHTAVAR